MTQEFKNLTAFQANGLELQGFTQLGGFQTALFNAYRLASGDNRERLNRAYPEWFSDLVTNDNSIIARQAQPSVNLSDWSRWNTELPKGQRVEINEEIYHELLGALPPRVWNQETSYFEVGEPHHHEEGRAIHRACWIEFGRYYTGYPTMANRYGLPAFKRNPALYERTFKDGFDLVRYRVLFTDDSQRDYIMTKNERSILSKCKNYQFIKLIGGEGYQKLKGGTSL
jgi:hypothetical protein